MLNVGSISWRRRRTQADGGRSPSRPSARPRRSRADSGEVPLAVRRPAEPRTSWSSPANPTSSPPMLPGPARRESSLRARADRRLGHGQRQRPHHCSVLTHDEAKTSKALVRGSARKARQSLPSRPWLIRLRRDRSIRWRRPIRHADRPADSGGSRSAIPGAGAEVLAAAKKSKNL
jgi:hypothetical protein